MSVVALSARASAGSRMCFCASRMPTYTALISELGPRNWDKALELFEDVIRIGVPRDAGLYTTTLNVLGQARQWEHAVAVFEGSPLGRPFCRFVQDASRRVGEAGAVEDAAGCALRNAAMREGAQRQVDAFYGQLDALRAG